MLDRLTRIQIALFVVVSLVFVIISAIWFVKLPQQLGFGRYPLAVDLPNTADLYPRALVTLRGVEVGAVTSLTLTDTGVRAALSIDQDTRLPVDSVVSVREATAIGEQYLNFEPRSLGGPSLQAGDVVPASKVVLPTPDAELLRSVNDLVSSVPTKDLRTTVNELSAAFSGSSANLRRLLDAAPALLDTAQANLAPTRGLIDDLEPVLGTQQRLAPLIRSLTRDLVTVTGQLRRSDPDLRGVLEKVPYLTDEADRLVNQLRPTVPRLLRDLTSAGQVLEVYLPNLRETLIELPVAVNQVNAAVYNDPIPNSAKLNFKATVDDPPPCTTGFVGRDQRDPMNLSVARPPADAYCKEPHDSRIGTRMGRNYPCPNNPAIRARHAAGCGLNFQSPREARRAQREAMDTQVRVANEMDKHVPNPPNAYERGGEGTPLPFAGERTSRGTPETVSSASHYDSATGLFLAPDGQPYLLGARNPDGHAALSSDWRSLLLGPMGLPTP